MTHLSAVSHLIHLIFSQINDHVTVRNFAFDPPSNRSNWTKSEILNKIKLT